MSSVLGISTTAFDADHLDFEIELIDYALPNETTESMSKHERLEWATSLKSRGNAFFSRGQEFCEAAMLKYLRILWVLVMSSFTLDSTS